MSKKGYLFCGSIIESMVFCHIKMPNYRLDNWAFLCILNNYLRGCLRLKTYLKIGYSQYLICGDRVLGQ